MRRSRSSRLVLAVLAVSAVVAGCAGLFGLEPLASDQLDGGSAPLDATSAVDAAAPSEAAPPPVSCNATGYPDPPAADSPSPGDVTIKVALSLLDFGIAQKDGGAPTPVGYNLDHFCTTGFENSCRSSATSADYKTYVKDKSTQGMDNSGFNLLQYLTTLGDPFKPENVNARLRAGEFGAVLVVSGYNGQPDDTSVNVEFFPSFGLQGADGGVTSSPTDAWLVDKGELAPDGVSSKTFAKTAYVKGGKLVGSFPSVTFAISVSDPDPRLTMQFLEGVITADIVSDAADGGAPAMRLTNGVIAGRWATSDFFASIGPLAYQGSAICMQATTIAFTKSSVVCPARDIMANGTLDGTDAGCNAFSAAAAFDTYAVTHVVTGTSPYVFDAGCPPIADCP